MVDDYGGVFALSFYCRVHFIYQLRQKNIFLTVGNDEELCPLIRVWNFDKRTKDGIPTLTRSIRPLAGSKQLHNVWLCIDN